jgi:hypothetical protein
MAKGLSMERAAHRVASMTEAVGACPRQGRPLSQTESN